MQVRPYLFFLDFGMECCEFEFCNFLFLFSAFLLWIVSSLLRVLPLLEQKSLHVDINGCVGSIFQVCFAIYLLLLPTIASLHKRLSYGTPDQWFLSCLLHPCKMIVIWLFSRWSGTSVMLSSVPVIDKTLKDDWYSLIKAVD